MIVVFMDDLRSQKLYPTHTASLYHVYHTEIRNNEKISQKHEVNST